jgi:uncharacterized protein (DUF924 family)
VFAEILRLDVFPRQIGCSPTPVEHATALALATDLVTSGQDKNLPPSQRCFVFLPFLHSAQLIDRERAVALFAGLRRETQEEIFAQAYDCAISHRDELLAAMTGGPSSG